MARTSATISVGADTRQLERDIQGALSRNFKLKGLNEKAFTQPLGRITGSANEFQKSLDASNARVIAFGASAGLIFTVEKAFTSLVKSTIDVQKSLTDINVILNASAGTLDKFGNSLFDIAKNTGQSFDVVAVAATELSRQGLGLEETLRRTQDALILTRLSGLDTASAVEALTATINSFNKAGLDSTTIINKLANVDAAFAVSSGDLAEAIKRVGSSASDAGVDFDELLAIVTSVQQTTARGGAVIGNSLKTIFTRIERTETLDQLEELGIKVRDLQGDALPAIQILSNLSNTFNTLASSQKAQVAETVGGIFQINILKAALGDLGKEYSVYDRALQTSANSTDQAIQRNEALNQTLSALINQTFQNLIRVSSDVGEISLGPTFKNTLEILNKGLESLSTDSTSTGGKIGKGILEGIGTFISGPGVILITAVFGKLLLNLGKFAAQSLGVLLNINTQSEQRVQIQAKINEVLAQEPSLVAAIYSKQISVLEVENQILNIIRLQTIEREKAAAVSATIAGGLIGRGVSTKGGSLKASAGFIPNFSASEIYGALAGGYTPGNIRQMNIPGKGNVTYNSAETVKNFPGMSQPAIMPPQDSKAGKNYKKQFSSAHGFNPYASEGFIPNFVTTPFQKAQKLFTEARSSKLDVEDLIRKRNYIITPEIRKEIEGIKTDPKKTAQTKGEVVTYDASKLGIVGVGGRRGTVDAQTAFSTLGYTKDPRSVKFVGIQARTLEDLKNSEVRDKNSFSTKINDLFYNPLAQLANDIFGPLSPDPKFKSVLASNTRKAGINLFPPGAEGSIFEAAVNLGTKKGGSLEAAFNQNASQKPFDFEEASPPATAFNSKFGFTPPVLRADAKRTISSEQAREIIDKAYRDAITRSDPKLPKPRIAASGFIPNFTALDNAIGREVAAGTATSKIRVGKDARLTSSANPLGLGVYNTKDEPRGLGQGIQRYGSKAKMAGAAAGFIPNFAELSFNPGSRGAIMDPLVADKRVGASVSRIIAKLKTQEITLDQANASLKQLTADYGLAASSQNRFNQILQSRGSQFASSAKSATLALDNSKKGFEKFGGAALAASFVIPMILQTVSQFNEGNKKLQLGINAASTALSLTAAGATFGVPGAIAGAAVGGGLGLYQYFEGLKGMDLEKLKNDIQVLQDEFNSTSVSMNQIIPLIEKYKEVQGSSLPDASKEEASLRIQNQMIENIGKVGPEFSDGILKALKEEDYTQVSEIINKALIKKSAELSNLSAQAVIEGAGKNITDKSVAGGISKAVTGLQTSSGKNIIQDLSKTEEGKAKIGETIQKLDSLLLQRASKEKQINDLIVTEEQIAQRRQAGEKEFLAYSKEKGSLGQKAVALIFGYNKALDEGYGNEKNNNEIIKLKEDLNKELNLNLSEYLQAVKPLYQTTEEGRIQFQKLEEKAKESSFNQEAGNKVIKDTKAYLLNIKDHEEKIAALLKSGISTVDQYILGFKNNTLNAKDAQEFYKKTFALQNDPLRMLGKSQNELNMSVATTILNEDSRNRVLKQLTEAEDTLRVKLANRQITEDQYAKALEGLKDKIILEQRRGGTIFAEDFRGGRQTARENKALAGQTQLEDFAGAFFDEFDNSVADSFRQAQLGAKDTANTIKSEFNNAFLSFANGTATASDAFTKMALNISDKIQQLAIEFSTNQIFGSLFGTTSNIFGGGSSGGIGGFFGSLFKSKGGMVKGYSSGGNVTGGSGNKDDVPAMLSGGEYVIRKSAVNKYGQEYLQMLNEGKVGKHFFGGAALAMKVAMTAAAPVATAMTAAAPVAPVFTGARGPSLFAKPPVAPVFTGTRGPSLFAKPPVAPVYSQDRDTAKYDTEDNYFKYGGRVQRFASGGEAQFFGENVYRYNDPFNPTGGSYVADPRLSYMAVTDPNNPQNKINQEREQTLYDYLNYVQGVRLENEKALQENIELNKRIRDEYNQQKSAKSKGAWMSFGLGVLGAGASQFSSMGGFGGIGGSASKYGASATLGGGSAARQNYANSSPLRYSTPTPRANGGYIRGFANGGSNGKDDIPALLMGGEFVMRKEAVNNYGKKFFDDLNSGRAKKFANGGMAGTITDEKQNSSSSTNNVNITINIDGQSSPKMSQDNSNENSEFASRKSKTDATLLANKIKDQVLNVINEQQRPGGLLSSSVYQKR